MWVRLLLGAPSFFNRDVAQLGSALDLGSRGRRFESCLPDIYAGVAELADALESGSSVLIDVGVQVPSPALALNHNGGLAQLGERLLCTQEVSGSIPLVSTILFK